MTTKNLTTKDFENIKKASLVLRSMNNKFRKEIIGLIYEKEKVGVTEIYKTLKMEQSVASLHLSILRKEGIVKTEREGKSIMYSINQERIDNVLKFVNELLS
jgi:hypothetical protein